MTTTERIAVLRLMKDRPSELDEPIAKLVKKIAACDPTSNEYPKLIGHLEVLTKLRDKKARRKVSPDTMLVVVGGIVQVIIIVGYERVHVMATKALGSVFKAKLDP